ncbi:MULTISPECIES: MFS transporter [unclassified Adlercreutzia]|uniref:MFS transporter n=1 Tax=unclassified Adlercreutzia TaxID=2636013 RepID=UPI0013EB2310|nr:MULTISPECIES: MFS transporter [unclassified Adlercreutzia]
MGEKTIWNTSFARLFLFEVLLQFGTTSINPIVSLYATALGASLVFAGFLAGLNSLCSLLFRIFGGLIQEGSERSVLVVAAVAFAASALICVPCDSLVALTASRIVLGTMFVFKSSVVVALASKLVPSDCIGRGVGWIGAAGVAANAIGPGVGSWLNEMLDFRAAFLFASVLFALAVLVALSLRDSQVGGGRGFGRLQSVAESARGKHRHIVASDFILFETVPLGLLAGFVTITFGSIFSLVLLVGDERGIAEVPVFFFVFALAAVLVRPVSGQLYDRYGLGRVLLPSAALMFAGIVVLALAGNVFHVALAAVFYALGQGGSYPTIQAECISCAPTGKATLAANTFYFGADAGMALGPLMSSLFYQLFGSVSMLLINAGFVFVLLVAYCLYAQRRVRS